MSADDSPGVGETCTRSVLWLHVSQAGPHSFSLMALFLGKLGLLTYTDAASQTTSLRISSDVSNLCITFTCVMFLLLWFACSPQHPKSLSLASMSSPVDFFRHSTMRQVPKMRPRFSNGKAKDH